VDIQRNVHEIFSGKPLEKRPSHRIEDNIATNSFGKN
jgi:hypothetical protein